MADLSSVEKDPIFPTIVTLSNPLKRNGDELAYALEQALSVLNKDSSLEDLRNCLGDDQVLAQIGDLTLRGLTDDNNPQIPTQVYSGDKTAFDTLAQGDFHNLPTETRTFYLYGNHHPDERVARYWEVLLGRLFLGDSLTHAHHIAKLDLKNYESANFPEMYYKWQWYDVNGLTGGLYQDGGDPRITDSPDDTIFVERLRKCISLLAYEFFDQSFPTEASNADPASLIGITVAGAGSRVTNGKSPTSVGGAATGSSTLLYAGAAMGLLGLILLKRKKSS